MKAGPYDLRSDATLVRAALASNPRAFETLIARHQVRAEALALANGIRAEALPDVLQEAFLRGFQNLSQLEKPAAFKSWFLQIVRNTARTSLRKRRRLALSLEQEPEEQPATDEVEMNEVRTELWRAVDSLSEGVREAICLYYYEGGSVKGVAKTLGISRSAAKDRLQRGRDALREKMWRKFGETIRGMVPTRRERQHRARRMSLLVISTTSPDACPVGPTGQSVVPATQGLGGGVLAGGMVAMGGKKILALGLGALVLLAVGVSVLRDNGSEEEDLGGSIGGNALAARSDVQEGAKIGALVKGSGAAAEDETHTPDPSLPSPVDLNGVDRDRDLFGVVVDEVGEPIGGAALETAFRPWGRLSLRSVERSKKTHPGPGGRSAADGSFALRLVPGQKVDLKVSAEGYAPTHVPERLAGERVRVVLQRPARLEVLVSNDETGPVPRADVLVWRGERGAQVVVQTCSTNQEGRCIFDPIQPGRVYLSLEHDVLGKSSGAYAHLLPDQTEEVKITIPIGRTVRGHVTDGDTGNPIAGAEVAEARRRHRAVSTDDTGAFEYPGWTDDRMDVLSATAEGYPWEARRVRDEEEIHFELFSGDEVVGRVVDPMGRPVGGVLVEAYGRAPARFLTGDRTKDVETMDFLSTETDLEGRFVFSTLRTEGSHSLTISRPGEGGLQFTFDHTLAVGNRIDLGDLMLEETGSIEGRALDGEGKPLPRAKIALRHISKKEEVLAGGLWRGSSYSGSESRPTDDIGRFRFLDLPPGRYSLSLSPGNAPRVHQRIDLVSGQHIRDVTLRLEPGRSLTVRIESGSGEPIERLPVVATYREGGVLRATTDASGRIVFRGLPEVSVSIAPMGGERYMGARPKTAMPADQEVLFVLQERVRIEGIILAPDGTPLRGMQIRSSCPGQNPRYGIQYSGPEGRFAFSVLAGAVVDIVVPGRRDEDPSYAVGSSRASPYRGEALGIVAPAKDVRIVARIVDYDRTLSVTLLDWDGKPMPDMRIGASNTSGPAGSADTGPDGKASFEGLPAEEVTVSVENRWRNHLPPEVLKHLPPKPPEDVIFPSTRLVPAGQEVTLRFERGVMVRGVALNPQGKPERSVMIFVHSEINDERHGFSRSDREGRFQFPVPKDLSFRIEAYRSLPFRATLSAKVGGLRGPIDDLIIKLSWSE